MRYSWAACLFAKILSYSWKMKWNADDAAGIKDKMLDKLCRFRAAICPKRKKTETWSMRRVRRILNSDWTFALEIPPVIMPSIKRARSTVNHNAFTSPVAIIYRWRNQAIPRAVDYNIWLLSINYDSARRSVSRFSRLGGVNARERVSKGSIWTRYVVTIMPVYGIINYKSVTTITSRVMSPTRFSRPPGIGQRQVCQTAGDRLNPIVSELRAEFNFGGNPKGEEEVSLQSYEEKHIRR